MRLSCGRLLHAPDVVGLRYQYKKTHAAMHGDVYMRMRIGPPGAGRETEVVTFE